MPGVIGFGALNMDKIMFVDKIPAPDEEAYVISVESHPGGSAPNTIAGLSRLGLRTGLIGNLGRDSEGKEMLGNLEGEGVETDAVVISSGRSGTALSMVDPDGLRSLVIDPGVNDEIPIRDIDVSYVNGFDLLHLTSFICRSTDLSFRTQLELAEISDVPLSLDPGQLYAERDLEQLEPIIRRCRVVMPNENELGMMTKLGPREGARRLIEIGSSVVVVKMGMKGCYVTDGEQDHHVPIYGGRGVDSTGAGDAFNAGFIYGLLNDLSLAEAAEIGTKVAWFSVQKPGARDGLPTLKELESGN
jgi:ribokinase